MNKFKNIAEKFILVASILGLVLMIGTVVAASMYVVPISDDFWYARTGIGVKGLVGRIVVAAKFSYEIYMEHQGTYFTSFFGSFFNPLISGGFPLLRVMMVINALFAFAALLAFVYVAVSRLGVKSVSGRVFILAIAAFVMTGYDAFQEVFYWYVGASVYGYPMSLGLVTLTMLLLANGREVSKGKQKLFYVIAAVTGFLAVGASLVITGSVCWLVLTVVMFYLIKDNKCSKGNVVVFFTCFAGAMINAVAPGNFLRQGMEGDGSFGLWDGIVATFKYVQYAYSWLFMNKNYAFIFLVLILTGFVALGSDRFKEGLSEKRMFKAYVLFTLMLIVAPFVTAFPVIMGYGTDWMPNRCFYILIVVMNIALGNLGLAAGCLLSYLVKEKAKKPTLIALAAVIVVLFAITPYNVREYIFLKMDKQLVMGEFQDNYVRTKELFDSFADQKGTDVEVDVPTVPEDIRNFYCFFLTDDPGSSINEDVAKAFGLNSIINRREEQ